MKINLDEMMRTLDGTPIEDSGRALRLKDVLVTACLTPLEVDRHQTGLAYRLYTLAHQLQFGGEVDLEASDAAFLQQRVEAVGFPPLTVGQVTDWLNGRSAPSAKGNLSAAA